MNADEPPQLHLVFSLQMIFAIPLLHHPFYILPPLTIIYVELGGLPGGMTKLLIPEIFEILITMPF